MRVHSLISEVTDYGYALALNGDKLRLTGTGSRPPAELLQRVHIDKTAIIAELQTITPRFGSLKSVACPVDLAETLAIQEKDGGASAQEAEQGAALKQGHDDLNSACQKIVAGWRYNLAVTGQYASQKRHGDMLMTMIAFCDNWGLLAAQLEWDAAALFGVDPNAPYPDPLRHNRHGIAVQLAILKHTGFRLVELTKELATFETPTKARKEAMRFHAARDEAVPIWEAVASWGSKVDKNRLKTYDWERKKTKVVSK